MDINMFGSLSKWHIYLLGISITKTNILDERQWYYLFIAEV